MSVCQPVSFARVNSHAENLHYNGPTTQAPQVAEFKCMAKYNGNDYSAIGSLAVHVCNRV